MRALVGKGIGASLGLNNAIMELLASSHGLLMAVQFSFTSHAHVLTRPPLPTGFYTKLCLVLRDVTARGKSVSLGWRRKCLMPGLARHARVWAAMKLWVVAPVRNRASRVRLFLKCTRNRCRPWQKWEWVTLGHYSSSCLLSALPW